jgi:hypothetical protein
MINHQSLHSMLAGNSDVKKPAKSARPGLGRFGPGRPGLSQARPRPDQARPSQAGRA